MTATLLLCAWLFGGAVQAPEKIVDVRVHGNHLTPDADVIRLSGLVKGSPFTATTIDEATKHLKQTGMFDDVDVLKRSVSIDDLPRSSMTSSTKGRCDRNAGYSGRAAEDRAARSRQPVMHADHRRRGRIRMALRRRVALAAGRQEQPIVISADGGGERRAGAEPSTISRTAACSLAARSRAARIRSMALPPPSAWARATTGACRGAPARGRSIAFGESAETVKSIGVTRPDTRLDPLLPRNAIYVKGSVAAVRITARMARCIGRRSTPAAFGFIQQTVLARACAGRRHGARAIFQIDASGTETARLHAADSSATRSSPAVRCVCRHRRSTSPNSASSFLVSRHGLRQGQRTRIKRSLGFGRRPMTCALNLMSPTARAGTHVPEAV